MSEQVKPYGSTMGKKDEVEQMFDNISHRYDFLNRLLSVGIDISWRNDVVAQVTKEQPKTILDVATGTGDLAIALAKKNPQAKITGFDLSHGMLEHGRKKVADKNQNYYLAQKQAYSKIVDIDNTLSECYLSSNHESGYYKQLPTELSSYGTYETIDGKHILSFKQTIAEDQYLSIRLRIQYPLAETDTFYEIIEWQSIYEREIPDDTFMNLIQ